MLIHASVGRAPADVSLNDGVYSLTLTARTRGEKQFLAGLIDAVESLPEGLTDERLRPPRLRVVVEHEGELTP